MGGSFDPPTPPFPSKKYTLDEGCVSPSSSRPTRMNRVRNRHHLTEIFVRLDVNDVALVSPVITFTVGGQRPDGWSNPIDDGSPLGHVRDCSLSLASGWRRSVH